MVRHKVTVILEVLRGKETPMAQVFLIHPFSSHHNTLYLATPHAPHFRNTPTWFPILSICQVKCVTLIYPNMIYVVWDRWIWVCSQSSHWKIGLIVRECVLFFWCLNFFSVYCNDLMYILHKTNIPHLGKRNIIFKSGGNMLLVDGFNALISKKQMDHVPKTWKHNWNNQLGYFPERKKNAPIIERNSQRGEDNNRFATVPEMLDPKVDPIEMVLKSQGLLKFQFSGKSNLFLRIQNSTKLLRI